LDGTLLTPEGTTSVRTRLALHRARHHGLTILAATGRPLRSVLPLLSDGTLTGLDYLAVSNGALVVDPCHLDRLEETSMPAADTRTLAVHLREAVPGLGLAWENGTHLTLDPIFRAITGRRRVVLDIDEASSGVEPTTPVHQLLALHPTFEPPELASLIDHAAAGNAVITHSGGGLVEIAAPDADKGSALHRLTTQLGIDLADVLAFGDGLNDLTMLSTVGWGVAMAGADPTVLRRADEITTSNHDDGVARVIERLVAPGP
jgi:hypothetical protein